MKIINNSSRIRIIICRHADSSGSGVEDSRGGKSILSSHSDVVVGLEVLRTL